MKILHVSDNHGLLYSLMDSDIVVHSGDFLPNRSRTRLSETYFQPAWIDSNIEEIKRWIGGRKFLLTPGNHDFIDPCERLREYGIDAINLNETEAIINGVRFKGFSPIPEFTLEWNYETDPPTLEHFVKNLNLKGVDILVAHAPMYGILDRNAQGERCGSKPMRYRLQSTEHDVKYYLCGHIHEANGIQGWTRGITVSNGATTQRVINV